MSQGKERMLICRGCPLYQKGVCNKHEYSLAVKDFVYSTGEQRFAGKLYPGCNCPLKAKTVNPVSMCPLGKW